MDAQVVISWRTQYAAVAFGVTTERGAINGSEILLVLSEVLTSSKRYACNSKICLFSKLYLYQKVMNDEATAEIQVCLKGCMLKRRK